MNRRIENIILAKGIQEICEFADSEGWEMINQSRASHTDEKGDSILSVQSIEDLHGLEFNKIYIHHSFFYKKNFFEMLKYVNRNQSGPNLLNAIKLDKEFQLIEPPKTFMQKLLERLGR